MGTHTGPIRVYGPSRLHWPGPLQASTPLWLFLITWGALAFGRVLIFVNIMSAIVLAAMVIAPWTVWWVDRASRSYVLIADRFHWEQVDRQCEAILRLLPRVSALDRTEVRSVIEAARWDLACLFRDQDRLKGLLRATDRSAAALAPEDPLYGELELRRTRLTSQLRSIELEVKQRVARLQSLSARTKAVAEEEAALRRQRAAARRAMRTLTRVDEGIAETAVWGTRADPAVDFTERAEAVLAAYRELNKDPIVRLPEGHREAD